MNKYIWILKAALHMRDICGSWKPSDLVFCWETASVIYGNYEYDGEKPGDPAEEIREELSRWGD